MRRVLGMRRAAASAPLHPNPRHAVRGVRTPDAGNRGVRILDMASAARTSAWSAGGHCSVRCGCILDMASAASAAAAAAAAAASDFAPTVACCRRLARTGRIAVECPSPQNALTSRQVDKSTCSLDSRGELPPSHGAAGERPRPARCENPNGGRAGRESLPGPRGERTSATAEQATRDARGTDLALEMPPRRGIRLRAIRTCVRITE